MDPISQLKQLRNISQTPQRRAELRSRLMSEISALPRVDAPQLTWRQVCTNMFHSGSTIALASFLFLLIVGGFSAWRVFTPFGFHGLDPVSLRVEADAIDIQIQLTGLDYTELSEIQGGNESTISEVVRNVSRVIGIGEDELEDPLVDTEEGSVGIDDILQDLLE